MCPGLPEQDRAAVETGVETAPDHGTGLGLWAVKWAAIRLGADLEFSAAEPKGTVVSPQLPDEAPAEPTEPALTEAD